MKIQIPKTICYDAPEGDYRAVLNEVSIRKKSDRGKEQNILRLVFEINSLTDSRNIYRAGKNYNTTEASKLVKDLKSWLGNDLDTILDEDGDLSVEKIEALQNREADIEIVHICNNSHDEPFRHIQQILPPGELVQDAIAA